MSTLDLLCLGELLIDFVSDTPGADLGGSHGFIKAPGGAPANVAVGVRRLGGPAGFVGCVGDDAFGRFLMGVLDDERVDISGMKTTLEGDTTLAFVSRRADGEREFAFYRRSGADTLLSPRDINDELLRRSRALHCCSVSMSREPARSATFYAMERARALGCIVSFDPNLRPPLWADLDEALDCCARGLTLADVIKVSEEEARWLSGVGAIPAAVDALWQPHMRLLVVTLGERGCYYRYAHGAGYVGIGNVLAIDTTGAGDAFVAGLLTALAAVDYRIAALEPDAVEQALQFANACGALTTTRPGAIPSLPTRLEVEQFLQRLGPINKQD